MDRLDVAGILLVLFRVSSILSLMVNLILLNISLIDIIGGHSKYLTE